MNIGLSTCSKAIDEKLFRDYKKNNISHIEISAPANEYKNLDYNTIRRLSEKYGIVLWSFHLPFSPFSEIDISKKLLKKKTVGYYTELIKKASDIGITKFVVHPSGEPILDRFRKKRMAYAKESLNELAEIAASYGSVILCENLPRTCLGRNSDEILELISVNDKLKVVFDTNHLLGEDYCEFIKKTANKIESVHVSDYDFLNERHWLPGEGKVEWNRLYNELQKTGYSGPWLYEIGFSCPNSIIRPRDLTCGDFSKNANEIFSGKELTVISSPVKSLMAGNKTIKRSKKK